MFSECSRSWAGGTSLLTMHRLWKCECAHGAATEVARSILVVAECVRLCPSLSSRSLHLLGFSANVHAAPRKQTSGSTCRKSSS